VRKAATPPPRQPAMASSMPVTARVASSSPETGTEISNSPSPGVIPRTMPIRTRLKRGFICPSFAPRLARWRVCDSSGAPGGFQAFGCRHENRGPEPGNRAAASFGYDCCGQRLVVRPFGDGHDVELTECAVRAVRLDAGFRHRLGHGVQPVVTDLRGPRLRRVEAWMLNNPVESSFRDRGSGALPSAPKALAAGSGRAPGKNR